MIRTVLQLASMVLLFAGLAASQDVPNLTGTWHLNVDRSRFGKVDKPVSTVVQIEHSEPQIRYSGTIIREDGESREFSYEGSLDGTPRPAARYMGEGEMTLRRVNDRTIESVFRSSDGSTEERTRTALSPDGNTLTRAIFLRSPQGSLRWTEIYDRQ